MELMPLRIHKGVPVGKSLTMVVWQLSLLSRYEIPAYIMASKIPTSKFQTLYQKLSRKFVDGDRLCAKWVRNEVVSLVHARRTTSRKKMKLHLKEKESLLPTSPAIPFSTDMQ